MSSDDASSKSRPASRSLFRNVLSRSSLHLPTSSRLSIGPTSRASISSAKPNDIHTDNGGFDTTNVPSLTNEQHASLQAISAPRPGAISADHSRPLTLPTVLKTPTSSGILSTAEERLEVSQPVSSPAVVIADSATPTISQLDPHFSSTTIGMLPALGPIPIGGTITNTVWVGLKSSLRGLRDNQGTLPHLSSAAGILLDCFEGIEMAGKNQEDYEYLAGELASLSDSLTEYTKPPIPGQVTKCISSVSVEIMNQAKEIQSRTGRGAMGRLFVAEADEEDVMRRYRRIQSLFRQLQVNLSVSAWSVANRHLVNTQLESLNPVKQATYDSTLSSAVSRRQCTEGTRIKILSRLDDWQRDDKAPTVYWMNGMAGTGKTTIACTFSERLERRELLAASFFCTRTSADCRNVTRIIPTIAYQLARYCIPFQSALHEILDKEPDAGSKNAEKQFERLLRDPLQKAKEAMPDNLVVVIDALDECDDHIGVEGILKMLFRYAPSIPLKFLVTSRPEPEIYKQMATHTQTRAAVHLHDIESTLVQADIALYLNEELSSMTLTPTQIGQLVEQSGSLFIYAATLVRYIQSGERRANPHKRLHSVLSTTPEATRRHAQIDALYMEVLKSALSEEEMEEDEMEDIRAVLRTVLFAQEPLNVETVAALAAVDDSERVLSALQPLRSVLHQSEETGLISILHASFPDFMFNPERAGEYFCDVLEHGHPLAARCFLAMTDQLRFNICELKSSFLPDEKVDNIQGRIKKNISPTLAYACRYWASHLALASKSDALLEMLEDFLCNRLLFWMEVLSLKRQMGAGMETLWTAKKWLNAGMTTSGHVVLVEDAYNFVTSFNDGLASQSTPHLYISSLPFCPRSSTVYKNYWKRTCGLLELKGSLMERREGAALATWNIGSEVYSTLYSPDGTRVAVGCFDHTVRLLNAHNGTPLVGPLKGHTGCVLSVAFSPNGKLLASGSADCSIRVWNVYAGTMVLGPLAGHSKSVYSVSFSPDGTRIVSGSLDGSICIWNVCDGTPLQGVSKRFGVNSVAYSPDGTLIASASNNDSAQLWNSRDCTPAASPFEGHSSSVSSVAFTPDGTRLVTGSSDNTIRIWRVPDGSLVTDPLKGHTVYAYSVAASPDGARIAFGSSDFTVRVSKTEDGALAAGPFVGHTNSITSVAYSPDGTRIISGSFDRTIRVWNVRDRLVPPVLFQSHIAELSSISLSGNNRIVSVSADRSVWTWDLTPGEHVPSHLKGKLVGPTTRPLPPKSPNFIFEAEDRSLYVVNITDSTSVAGPLYGNIGTPTSFAFSSTSNLLAIASISEGYSSEYTILIWDLTKEMPIAGPFHGHKCEITSLELSPDPLRVVSCSAKDKTIRVWSTCATILEIAQPPRLPFLASAVDSSTPLFEGWKAQEDGWVINRNSELLFWIPPDIAPVSLTPHVEFIISRSGVLHIPKWELLINDQWSKCYISD